MPELDMVRGIAILMVVLFHGFEDFAPTGPSAPGWERLFLSTVGLGWAGVNVFFVLSGFLITGILLDSVDNPRYYSRFYSRRALRILPAYYLLIAVILMVGRISFVTRRTSWAFAGLSFVYLSNITPLLGVSRDYAPLWSLAVEEHFYLLWPAAVRRLRSGVATLAALVCLCEPFLRAICAARGGLWWGPYTWLSADGLALGALLAVFARSGWSSRRNLLWLAVWAGLFAIVMLAASVRIPRFMSISLRATCVSYGSFSLVAAVLWLGTGEYRRFVNVPILSFYGFISYGLYLIHALLFSLYNDVAAAFVPSFRVEQSFVKCLVRLVVVLAIATGTAYLSRTTYEEYFLRMKDKLGGKRERAQPAQPVAPVLSSQDVRDNLVPDSRGEIARSE